MLTCYNVADFFIHLANETGSYISNLKLQKLVYYAQAWHLAIYATPLFEEDFEAWVHSPVIPALYREYKSFGWQPILKDVQKPELTENIAGQNAIATYPCASGDFSRDRIHV